ncbi:MAG: uracil phosphoribosyltransferase [Oscillospiraceae bacterium]|nr:uracil phosphoribosyltransferase [Oscillospiraceae bacterium]MBQ5815881.1 uracil phosphoribosyltransferase [Oscillospiraceae bacterium]
MKNVTVFDHPLIQHKTTIMRQKDTSNKEFRENVEEITMLMCYEALRDLPLADVEIETPLTKTTQKMVAGKPLAVVPILRAGLGMVNGLLALVPTAKVGHIGMYRDEETLIPHEYYCKLPPDIDKRLIVVVDPMLATGGSAIDAITQIKSYGGQHIKFLCLIAAPEGIKALTEAHPDVQIYCANVDEKLNENGYIVPGLGDAGDRIFGTK